MIQRRTDAWGRTIFEPEGIIEMIMNGTDVSALLVEESPLVTEYNEWCARFNKGDFRIENPAPVDHTPEQEHAARAAEWMISDEMQTIDVRGFLLTLCKDDEQRERTNHEMDLFEHRGLIPLLQLMMFLVDHFRRNGIVWGVGRGSSVASFVLYLIGVHKIDPIRYGLDVHEFLKD